MRCDELRIRIEEEAEAVGTDLVREHLKDCAPCRAWLEDWRTLRLGFQVLAGEPVPEPQLGFETRVLRRLEQAVGGQSAAFDFFERAGRRVVWATLTLALAILLALALPSSGPLRAAGEPDYLLPEPSMASLQTEPLVDVDATSPSVSAPAPAPARSNQ